MEKRNLICDVCHTELEDWQVEDWLSVSPPTGTKFSHNSVPPHYGNYYGLFCSVECFQKRVNEVRNSDHNGGAIYVKDPS